MSTRRAFLVQATVAGAMVASVRAVSGETAAAPGASMRSYKIPQTDLVVSRIAYGGYLGGLDPRDSEFVTRAAQLMRAAYENGITFFDSADIYGVFKSEVALGEMLRQSRGLRHKVVIQTKCGILYTKDWQLAGVDLSHDHIISSAEGSLKRIGVDHLDILLLHQPDALARPEEVAKALDELKRSGKVRYFGVSNHTVAQIELLKKYFRQPIVVNQFLLGLANLYPAFNYPLGGSHYMAESGIIDYCRLNDIQIQAWSPVRGGLISPTSEAKPEVKRAAKALGDLAEEKGVTPAAIALAWLLSLPAGIVPILGSTNPQHIAEDCAADRVVLSRDEWYALFAIASAIPS